MNWGLLSHAFPLVCLNIPQSYLQSVYTYTGFRNTFFPSLFLINLNCLTSSAVTINVQQHSCCFRGFKMRSQKADTALVQAYIIWANRILVPLPASICRSGRRQKEKQKTVHKPARKHQMSWGKKVMAGIVSCPKLLIKQNHNTLHKEDSETEPSSHPSLEKCCRYTVYLLSDTLISPPNQSDKATAPPPYLLSF